MADVTVKKIDEFKTKFYGSMRLVRAGLGVTSFGIQLEELPPNTDAYPEHDHSHDGQEEVYIILKGSTTLKVGDDSYELGEGSYARVGPEEKRKLITSSEGATVLALGATPGAVYQVPDFSKEETEG